MALVWRERWPMKQVCTLSSSLGQVSNCPFGFTFHILSGSVLRTWTVGSETHERILSLNPQSQVTQIHLLGKVVFLHFDHITIYIFKLIRGVVFLQLKALHSLCLCEKETWRYFWKVNSVVLIRTSYNLSFSPSGWLSKEQKEEAKQKSHPETDSSSLWVKKT